MPYLPFVEKQDGFWRVEVVINSLERKKRIFIVYSLVIPMVLLIGLVVIPTIGLFRMSSTNWDGYSAGYDWIKPDNYIAMLKNKDLWMSLRSNAAYFVGHLLFILVELIFAVLLTFKLWAAKFYKTVMFMSYIISGVAVVHALSYFSSPVNGTSDVILSLFHLDGLIWNQLPDIKIINYVLTSVSLWRFSGYHVVLFIVVLQFLPQDAQEAAEVDGANAWQLFRYTQIPSIMLTVDLVLFDDIRGASQVFDILYVMIGGGPGYAPSTSTLYIIDTALKYSNLGLVSTMAVAIMLMIVVVYLIQNRIIHGIVLKGVEK